MEEVEIKETNGILDTHTAGGSSSDGHRRSSATCSSHLSLFGLRIA